MPQQTININAGFGVIGELFFDGPVRGAPYNLVSTPQLNLVGNVFTVVSGADPDNTTGSPLAGTAMVGGTGVFAGILANPKVYASAGTALGGPLAATLVLPDNTIGELVIMGEMVVNLPGPANVGDLVTYDATTGNLNSITPTTSFTASIAAGGSSTADVMTVTAVSKGRLAVGQLITGTGVLPGTRIGSLGSGTGYTGTYNLTTINLQTVSSEVMTAPNVPDLAFAASVAHIATSVGVDTLTITTLTSGQLSIGTQIFGTGVAPNTVITAFGTGTGGTGTYILNTSGQTVGAIAMTGPANLFVPNAVVDRFTANTTGGTAVIKLTN